MGSFLLLPFGQRNFSVYNIIKSVEGDTFIFQGYVISLRHSLCLLYSHFALSSSFIKPSILVNGLEVYSCNAANYLCLSTSQNMSKIFSKSVVFLGKAFKQPHQTS